jgi:hypothetical protein
LSNWTWAKSRAREKLLSILAHTHTLTHITLHLFFKLHPYQFMLKTHITWCDAIWLHEEIFCFFLVLDNPGITHLAVIDGNEIVENNTAIIQCKVESNPLSKVEWSFKNDTVYKGNSDVIQSNYTIQRAKCVDTGFYMCTATNIINMESYSVKKVVQLSVKCKN